MYNLVCKIIICKHQHCAFIIYQSLSVDNPVRHCEHIIYIKFQGCDIWFSLSKVTKLLLLLLLLYVQSTQQTVLCKAFLQIPNLEYFDLTT